MYVTVPLPATREHSSVLPASVPGLGVSPQRSEAPRTLRVVTQSDDGGGKQKEARLSVSVIFFPLAQGKEEATGIPAVPKVLLLTREGVRDVSHLEDGDRLLM